MTILVIGAIILTGIFGVVLALGFAENDDEATFGGLIAIIAVWIVVAMVWNQNTLTNQINKQKDKICQLKGGTYVGRTCIKGEVIK